MKLNDIPMQLQKYYLERDLETLSEIVRLASEELENPELQEASITIPTAMNVMEATIKTQGFIKLGLDDADSTGPVAEGQLIRVFPQTRSEDEGFMVLTVAQIANGEIILVPGGA